MFWFTDWIKIFVKQTLDDVALVSPDWMDFRKVCKLDSSAIGWLVRYALCDCRSSFWIFLIFKIFLIFLNIFYIFKYWSFEIFKIFCNTLVLFCNNYSCLSSISSFSGTCISLFLPLIVSNALSLVRFRIQQVRYTWNAVQDQNRRKLIVQSSITFLCALKGFKIPRKASCLWIFSHFSTTWSFFVRIN